MPPPISSKSRQLFSALYISFSFILYFFNLFIIFFVLFFKRLIDRFSCPGLSCVTQDFHSSFWHPDSFSCGMWDLVSWPEVEPWPADLGGGVLATGPAGKSCISPFRTHEEADLKLRGRNSLSFGFHLVTCSFIQSQTHPPSATPTMSEHR